MVRTLLIVAAAGLVLMLVSFAAAVGLGGPELLRGGWTLDMDGWDRNEDRVGWSGPVAEADLEWTGTDTLTIAVPAYVTFTQGPEVSVHVRGPQEAIDRLTFEGGRLAFVDEERHRNIVIFGRDEGLQVTITAPDVSRFVLEGHGDLDLNALDLASLAIVVEGAGDITARGRATALDISIEGAGDADLEGLTAETAEVRIDGAGDIDLNVTQAANVVINGAGDVDFVTRPARLTQEISGVGSVDAPN